MDTWWNSSYGTTVQAININSLGNATDFGNLLAVKGTTTGLSNKVRAISAGGFNNPGVSNVIESSILKQMENRFWRFNCSKTTSD